MSDTDLGKIMLEKAREFIDKRYPKGWGGCAVMYTQEGEFLISVYLDSHNSAAELCMETGASARHKSMITQLHTPFAFQEKMKMES